MSAITFSENPRVIADGLYVFTTTSSTWDSKSDGSSAGDTLRVTDTGMTYVWTGNDWIPDLAYAEGTWNRLAYIDATTADLTTQGMTNTTSSLGTHTTTLSGGRVIVSSTGDGVTSNLSNTWNVSAATANRSKLITGYFNFAQIGTSPSSRGRVYSYDGTRALFIRRMNNVDSGQLGIRGGTFSQNLPGPYFPDVTSGEAYWDMYLTGDDHTGYVYVWRNNQLWAFIEYASLLSSTANFMGFSTVANSDSGTSTLELRDVRMYELDAP